MAATIGFAPLGLSHQTDQGKKSQSTNDTMICSMLHTGEKKRRTVSTQFMTQYTSFRGTVSNPQRALLPAWDLTATFC